MPIKISDLAAKVRHLTVDLGEGDQLTISYKPNALTLADEQALVDAQADGTATAKVADQLCKLLVLWDVVDEDDTPLPITPETMDTLPGAVLASVLTAIREDQSPNARNGRR